ncbi:hypothetical protein JM81_1737 [Maribacter sp. MAR_2009_72]|nr:hypothetical protein JM81_1737 [Maribacter sp. MAR_2009_72]
MSFFDKLRKTSNKRVHSLNAPQHSATKQSVYSTVYTKAQVFVKENCYTCNTDKVLSPNYLSGISFYKLDISIGDYISLQGNI